MKFTSLSFSLVLSLAYVGSNVYAGMCHDYSDYPYNYKTMKKTKCDMVESKIKKPANLKSTNTSTVNILDAQNAFQIDFNCGINDAVLCKKANNAFISVGKRIASIINFNTPVIVNATFTDFCKEFGECTTAGSQTGMILGSASPARTIPMRDNDNVIRQYPQSLVKQMQLTNHPEFSKYDITANFNALANMFFSGDNNGSIGAQQFDFEYIVTHEFTHGLGFASSWTSYFTSSTGPVILTPFPSFLDLDNGGPIKFTGFEEFAFDKYMTIVQGNKQMPMTNLTKRINLFVPDGTAFVNDNAFLLSFSRSQEFQMAKSLLGLATTKNTMSFVPPTSPDNAMILETGINPYQPGSSISHIDRSNAVNSDFLMVFSAQNGVTLDSIITKNNNPGGGPYGPKTIKLLETLGYATQSNPTPYKPSSADPNTSNAKSSSSTTIHRSSLLISEMSIMIGIIIAGSLFQFVII